MLHYTCDLCGKELVVEEDCRYVVKIEVHAAGDTDEASFDGLDEDHLEEMAQLLEEVDDLDESAFEDDLCKNFRFDLCAGCYRKFLKNPLTPQPPNRIGFSDN